jgi:hypothetical protein
MRTYLSEKIPTMKDVKQVYAVATGCTVQYSSSYDPKHTHYPLDYEGEKACWQARGNVPGQ